MAPSSIDHRLTDELRTRGMRVTPQRLLIHRTLCAEAQHMTAEQVLGACTDALPGTSLPTVYATLELLEELGLVHRIGTGNGAVLFDSRIEPHAHTVCRECGATADLDGPPEAGEALVRAGDSGFFPEHAQVVVWGLCATCARGRAGAGAERTEVRA